MSAGPAACSVSSLRPLRLTPSATSLSSCAKKAGALLLLRALCAHPRRTNTNKSPQQRPSAHPWGAGRASVGNWRTGSQTAAPSLSCICHNCDLMEQSGNAVTRWGWLFHSHSSHCPLSLSLSRYLCPRASDYTFSFGVLSLFSSSSVSS